MLKQTIYILAYTNIGSLMIPVGIGLVYWQRLSLSLRLAWGGLLSYLLLFLLSLLIIKLQLGTTLFIDCLVSASVGSLFALCFAAAVPPGKRRWLIIGLGLTGLTGLLIEAVGQNHLMQPSVWSVSLQTIINTIIVLVYLQFLIRTVVVSLLVIPLFWLSMGRLISALTSTVYDALHTQIFDSSRELALKWMAFQLIISISCNVLYGISYRKVSASA